MTGPLLDKNGKPIRSIDMKKADPPKLGPAFGDWAQRDISYATLPGGGVVQFDLDNLELSDYRAMIDHYQINASLAVLSFMQHQSDFHVECDDQKIADFCDEQLHYNWTMLNRSLSTANWAGFTPNALEWDNDYNGRSIVLTKIKDLIPEECCVNWKLEKGWAPPGHLPPKFKTFDGIRQMGIAWPIPVENSFWYPLLMEQGNYYGRKLLRPAFQSWFFSILIHLFANRYYERFGEPTPVGRAPYDEDITMPDGTEIKGNTFLLQILQQLRSRSAVVLPNTGHQDQNGREQYDYDIEYLESQMRGADFERYLTRLDEEMSIGLFTPILLLRTADVGSYNLGQGHMQVYLWMLNALNDDRAYYIDRYILSKMVDYNFSEKAPRARIVFRKLGNASSELIKDLLTALINQGLAKPDLVQLGELAGLTIEEIQQTIAPVPKPNDNPPNDKSQTQNTAKEISTRVRQQIQAGLDKDTFEGLRVNMGYKRKFERALNSDNVTNSIDATDGIYKRMDSWLADVVALGASEFPSADSFMGMFDKVLNSEIARAVDGV